ncbi:MAG: hypothetical protein GC154_15830 [bacterium]|nr:hypothetical protein [bacterium]
MNESSLRERLLEAEPMSAPLREQYEKELQTMLTQTLTPMKRAAYYAASAFTALQFVLFTCVAVMAPAELPMLARLSFIGGALACAVWTFYGFRVARRGTMNLKRDPDVLVGIVWGVVVLVTTVSLMLGMGMQDAAQGGRMILSALVFLVMGGLFMTQRMIERSELKVREKLLELELRVAELDRRGEN